MITTRSNAIAASRRTLPSGRVVEATRGSPAKPGRRVPESSAGKRWPTPVCRATRERWCAWEAGCCLVAVRRGLAVDLG